MSTGKSKLWKYCRITAVAAWLLLVLLMGSFSSATAASPFESQESPVNPAYEAYRQQRSQAARASSTANKQGSTVAAEPAMGYMPHPFNMGHIKDIPVNRANKAANIQTATNQAASTTSTHTTGTYGLPATYDWRTQNKVTPVRDQNPCGTCWIFGSMASLESKVYIQNSTANDFSEQNLACCVDPAWTYLSGNKCNAGGDSFIAAETLIRKGTKLEGCDPYNYTTINTEACNANGCATGYMVTNFRIITNSVVTSAEIDLVKSAIFNTGPVTTSFCWGSGHIYTSGGFNNVYYWPGCVTAQNHLVCIVGWDDTVPHPAGGGTGAWIIKNSWGTAWANAGYFYMCYGSGNMGEIGSYLGFKDYNARERLYTWDEAGMTAARGYSGTSAWMASVYTAATAGSVTHVDFWTTSNNAQYQAYIYNGSFGSMLTTQAGTCAELGYYSIPLTSPVTLTAGQVFTVAVKMTTPGYNYPIPVERADFYSTPTIQSGVSFMRYLDSDSWTDLAPASRNAVCRVRVLAAADDPGIQKLIGTDAAGSLAQASWSNTAIWVRYQAASAGPVSEIRCKVNGSNVNAKAAIYSEVGGLPGTCLASNNMGVALTSDAYTAIPLSSSYSVTSGAYYWLAVVFDGHTVYPYYAADIDNINRNMVVNYDSFSFTNNPSGYSPQYRQFCLAGWGPTGGGVSPTIGISPSSFTFNATQGGSNPNNQTLNISNSGGGTLIWSLSDDAGWLTPSPTTGTDSGSSVMAVNISGMTAGTHNANITITASGATNAPQIVPITLIIAPSGGSVQKLIGTDAAGSLAQASWSNTAIWVRYQAASAGPVSEIRCKVNGSNVNAKAAIYSEVGGLPGTCLASNNMGVALTSDAYTAIPLSSSYSVTSGAYYWLAVVFDGHTVYPYYAADIDNINRNMVVNYDSFSFANNPSGYSPQYRQFCLAGWGPTGGGVSPTIGISPSSFTFNATQGGSNPNNQTLNISNSGGGTLIWSLSDDAGWLTPSPTTGTDSGSSVMAVNISGMTAGTHNANITITASGATNAPQIVPITLIIAPSGGSVQKLIGTDAAGSLAQASWSNTAIWVRYQAASAGPVSEIRCKVNGSNVNAKAAIYSEVGGLPGTCLASNNTGVALTSDAYTAIPLSSSYSVTSGAYYWLAVVFDGHTVYPYYAADIDNINRNMVVNYDSFSFTNNPSGYSPQYRQFCLAGWGPTGGGVSPTIGISPSSFTFNATQGGSNPNNQTLNISNSGGGTLIWSLSDDAGWLTPSPTTSTDSGSSVMAVNISGMTAGTHNANITITASGATNAPQIVPITLIIAPSGGSVQKLIGTDAAGSLAQASWSNTAIWVRYQAASAGPVSEIRCKVNGSNVNAKAAIYSEVGGLPGTCLASNNTGVALTSDAYTAIPLSSSYSVTSGAYYWLAVVFDGHTVYPYYAADIDNINRNMVVNYDSFSFTNNPSGYSPQYRQFCLAGWGPTAPIVAPSAPLIKAPGTSILFKWNAADTATNYGLQVSTTGDFQAGTFAFNNLMLGNMTQYEVTGLSLDATYYWRINASNSGGTSSWSQARSITVQMQ